MKKLILSLSILTAGVLSAQNSSINVEINNIKNSKGYIALALYDSEKNFTKKDLKSTKVNAKKGKISVRFDNLPEGNYAIAILHDENSNEKMDFNMLGIPKEDYGFSNNAKGVLAPPKFKDASFKLSANEAKKVKITL